MPNVVASILSVCSLVFSLFLQKLNLRTTWKRNVFLIWLFLSPLFLLTGASTFSLCVAGFFLFCLLPFQKSFDLPPLYIATLPAIPYYASFNLPFPGINYLIAIDFPMIWSLMLCPFVLLYVPKFFRKLTIVDKSVLSYVTFISILNLRDTTFTNGLRLSLENCLIILIPYFCITCLSEGENFYKIFESFALLSLFFCSIGMFSILKQWNFFDIYNPHGFADYRYGFLRIGGPVIPSLFGFICGVGLLLMQSGFFNEIKSKILKFFVFFLLMLSLFMTISRGAWLCYLMLMFIYSLFSRKIRNKYILSLLAMIFLCLLYVFFLSPYDSSTDPFGTFNFRQQLYEASLLQFYTSPLLGDPNYLESKFLQALPQGGGIIDIVSFYLQVVLQYGLIGLILYLLPFGILVCQLVRQREIARNQELQRKTIAILIATLLTYLILIGTTSSVSLISHFGWILVASAQSFLLNEKRNFKESTYAV